MTCAILKIAEYFILRKMYSLLEEMLMTTWFWTLFHYFLKGTVVTAEQYRPWSCRFS